MSVVSTGHPASNWQGSPIELVHEALELLEQERAIFLEGQYAKLAPVIAAKAKVLERLEITIHSVSRSADFLNAVRTLIEASRRNEQIIRAAQQGLAHARRRLTAIDQTRSGAVAYAEDGTRITSRADAVRDRNTA